MQYGDVSCLMNLLCFKQFNYLERKFILFVCHVTMWWLVPIFVLETTVTIEFPSLTVLRRVASDHHLFTPLPMKLMNKIMSRHWKGYKIESIC